MRSWNHSTIQRLLFALAATIVALVSGCAGSGGSSTAGAGLPADCIVNRGVRDYTALDNRNLILYGPGRRAYHVVMATQSNNLSGEFRIGIYDRDGRICPFGGDAIIVDGPIAERIPIRSIEAVDDAAAEALKVQYGVIEGADGEVTVTEVE